MKRDTSLPLPWSLDAHETLDVTTISVRAANRNRVFVVQLGEEPRFRGKIAQILGAALVKINKLQNGG